MSQKETTNGAKRYSETFLLPLDATKGGVPLGLGALRRSLKRIFPELSASSGELKKCSRCGETKQVQEFYRKKNPCKSCASEYGKAHYYQNKELRNAQHAEWARQNPNRRRETINRYIRKTYATKREYINQIKASTPCADCGNSYPPYVMDFDHLGNKTIEVSKMPMKRFSLERIRQEVAKCEVVCSNCHRERTHQRKQKESAQ